MLGRAFLVVSVGFLLLLGYAFYQDLNRPWLPIQQAYAQKYGADFPIQVQQLFPRVQVNNQFVVERCITCHVPDIQKIGPQEAASRLGPNHPSVINDAVFAKYGQDTLICRRSSRHRLGQRLAECLGQAERLGQADPVRRPIVLGRSWRRDLAGRVGLTDTLRLTGGDHRRRLPGSASTTLLRGGRERQSRQ